MRNVPDKNCRENQNIFYVQQNIFQKLCRLQENVEEYGRAGRDTNEKYNRVDVRGVLDS